jgi:hypothetical protein
MSNRVYAVLTLSAIVIALLVLTACGIDEEQAAEKARDIFDNIGNTVNDIIDRGIEKFAPEEGENE